MIAIKPERLLELLAERQVVGGLGLTLSVRHAGFFADFESRGCPKKLWSSVLFSGLRETKCAAANRE